MDLPLLDRVGQIRVAGLELVILATHLVLYPTGIAQARPLSAVPKPATAKDGGDKAGRGRGDYSEFWHVGDAPAPELERTSGPLPAKPSTPPSGNDRLPVLLLHGFVDNRAVFTLLRRSLTRHGWQHVHALNYSPLTFDSRKAAALLGKHVEQLCEHTGHPRIDIVGHSLGGLIARYYVQRLGGDSRVRTVVTLGTPHSGTTVGSVLDLHPVVRQMRPGSSLLAELAAPARGCSTRFVSFWSDSDQMMSPVETARLDHPDLDVRNVLIPGVGHLTLPVHSGVAAGIRQALAEHPTPPGSRHAA